MLMTFIKSSHIKSQFWKSSNKTLKNHLIVKHMQKQYQEGLLNNKRKKPKQAKGFACQLKAWYHNRHSGAGGICTCIQRSDMYGF